MNIIINNSSPDGLDNFHWTPLGLPYFIFKATAKIKNKVIHIKKNWKTPKKNIVSCYINTNTDKRRRGTHEINRERIINTLTKNNIHNHKTSSINEFYEGLLNSKFTISPEGNGIDCHRHYEAWCCGCIPIIEDNELIRKKYEGLPILFTKDYSEITQEYLEEKYNEIMSKSYNFDKLMVNYYSQKEQQRIKYRCNYWINKRLGFTFYK